MRYRGENLVENSVNEGCRGWDLEDMAGDSLRARPGSDGLAWNPGGRWYVGRGAMVRPSVLIVR
jgi:hypothetical protein